MKCAELHFKKEDYFLNFKPLEEINFEKFYLQKNRFQDFFPQKIKVINQFWFKMAWISSSISLKRLTSLIFLQMEQYKKKTKNKLFSHIFNIVIVNFITSLAPTYMWEKWHEKVFLSLFLHEIEKLFSSLFYPACVEFAPLCTLISHEKWFKLHVSRKRKTQVTHIHTYIFLSNYG